MRSQRLPIFYNENQNVKDFNDVFCPSPGKPARFVNGRRGIDRQLTKVYSNFKPLPNEIIKLAHDSAYVDGIMNLEIDNGFGNRSEEIRNSLPWAMASFVYAALYALKHKTVTCSPVSGLHHATYSHGSAYCTFNGLMIAAEYMKRKKLVSSVGIIDFDAHYGNGTDDIIRKLKADYVKHYSFAKTVAAQNNDPSDFVISIERELEKNYRDVDILYYYAGADPHINDGRFLTSKEMYVRDLQVFGFAKKYNIPVVWSLGGGYQTPFEKVLNIHYKTLWAYYRTYVDRETFEAILHSQHKLVENIPPVETPKWNF